MVIFQSTLPRRERPGCKVGAEYCETISIHAPAKGATTTATSAVTSRRFQSTLPRRERRICRLFSSFTTAQFQSTLPRRERLFAGKIKQNPLHISIHAPAKGATGVKGNFGVIIAISIHAPAKGATRGAPLTRRTRWISIHAPAKGATREFAKLDEAEWISIHAPAKGATLSQHSAFRPSPHFNPRSREGSDKPSVKL